MFYEVIIPSIRQPGYDSVLQIEAKSWQQAMNTGLQAEKLDVTPMNGFHIDIADDRIRVTDPNRRRTIRIRTIPESEKHQSGVLKAITGAHAAIGDARPAAARAQQAPQKAVAFTNKATGAFRAIGVAEIPRDNAAEGRVLSETKRHTGELAVPDKVARMSGSTAAATPSAAPSTPAAGAPGATGAEIAVADSALEDVFLDITTIFEGKHALEDAVEFVLDLAWKYIPSKGGAVLFAADDSSCLYFASTRGDEGKKLNDIELPIDRGLPALSLREGISLAVHDPALDPRHDTTISRAGVTEKSLCVVPIQSNDRTYGVLLMLNRRSGSGFSEYDANILAYIGSQLGRFIEQLFESTGLD